MKTVVYVKRMGSWILESNVFSDCSRPGERPRGSKNFIKTTYSVVSNLLSVQIRLVRGADGLCVMRAVHPTRIVNVNTRCDGLRPACGLYSKLMPRAYCAMSYSVHDARTRRLQRCTYFIDRGVARTVRVAVRPFVLQF